MGSVGDHIGAAPIDCGRGLLVVPEVQEPARCLLKVSGELDLATADLLTGAIDRAAADYPEVGVDLSAVAFCDVVGATTVERALRRAEAQGRRLTLYGVERPLRLLLTAGGLFSALRQSCPRPDLTASPDAARH